MAMNINPYNSPRVANWSWRAKGLVLLLVAAVIAVALWWLIYRVAATALITIESSNPADYVSITPVVNDTLETGSTLTAQHVLKKSLSYGTYDLEAFDTSNRLSRIIHITSNSPRSYLLTLNHFSGVAVSAYGSSVTDLVASTDQLVFLNAAGHLQSINAAGNIQSLDALTSLTSVVWATPETGLATDSRGDLYRISNGSVQQITLPFKATPNITFADSADGSIFVGHNKKLYYATSGGRLSPIYHASSNILAVSASNNGAAVIEGSLLSNPDGSGSLVLVSTRGLSSDTGLNAKGISWSHDGKLIAVRTNNGGLNIYAVRNGSLSITASIPNYGSLGNMAWGTNEDLYYSQGGTVWEYSSGSGDEFQIAQTPGQMEVLGVYPDSVGNYVYITVDDSGQPEGEFTNSELYRIPLKNQPVNLQFSALAGILPTVIQDTCAVNYLNISYSPVFFVAFPATATQQFCSTEISDYLNQYGINPSAGTFVYQPQPIN